MTILPVADKIFGDEKAVAYYEMHEHSRKGFRRYRIIHVIRGDVVCEWREDMGPARNFRGVNQLRIPSFLEYTVDELKGMANEMRAEKVDVKDLLSLNNYVPG
jgi:hypothetical protein